LYWGDDLLYIDSYIKISKGNSFLSTGREHRDFFTLSNAFGKLPQIPLEIYTNLHNYDNNYTALSVLENKYPNVKINFVEKSSETTAFLAQKAAECFCVVIPVEKEEMYYCIGFTSVVEAMAMSKPIISTRNPYYPINIEKEGFGLYADDEESWIKAINYLYSNPGIAAEMGRKGRKLAEEKFNILECSKQIDRLINE
jgi:glycosyltransferase involved in cell wall biosynthesis